MVAGLTSAGTVSANAFGATPAAVVPAAGEPDAVAKSNNASPPAGGQGLWYFPPVETHLIRSKYVAQTYKIQVARPSRRRSDTARLPVVYVTDGNVVFTLFKEISHMLQHLGIHPFPSFILVGIGYPSDVPYAGSMLRTRDYHDPYAPNWNNLARELAKSYWQFEGLLFPEDGIENLSNSRGADNFGDFIEKELIPFIDEHYQTIPRGRTYFGHSGGGGFGLYTLCTRPQLFKNYILSSPGRFSYKGEDISFRMVRERLIEPARALHGVKLYMSIGTDEDLQPFYYAAHSALVTDFFRMTAMLKDAGIAGLDLMIEVIPNETHILVWPIAFMHGVQAVFGLRQLGGMIFPPGEGKEMARGFSETK